MRKGQCSNIFEEVFDSRCGGIARTCSCGITYFDSSQASCFDEGELEEYFENAKADPLKFIECDHSIGTMSINGEKIVIGCSCDRAEAYEMFIVKHRHNLAKYLGRYVESLIEDMDIINEHLLAAKKGGIN